MVVRTSYLHNGITYTGKMSSLYYIGVLRFGGAIYSTIKQLAIQKDRHLPKFGSFTELWNVVVRSIYEIKSYL